MPGHYGRIVRSEEALNERANVRQIDALRVRHAGAVAVRHERIDRHHDARAAQQIGSTRVAEAEAALALGWIRRELDEVAARQVVAGHKLGRRKESREEEHLIRLVHRRPASADESLYAVTHEVDAA